MGSRNHYAGLCHAPSQQDHVVSLAILKNIFLSRPYLSHFFPCLFLAYIRKSVIVFYLKSLCPHNIMCLALFAPGVDTVFLFIEACKGGFDGPTINLSITPTTLLKQFPFSTKGEKNAWIFPLSWPLENIPPSLQSWSTWTIIFLKGSIISTTIATNHFQFLPMIHTLRLHKRVVQLLTFEYVINIAHLCYCNRRLQVGFWCR